MRMRLIKSLMMLCSIVSMHVGAMEVVIGGADPMTVNVSDKEMTRIAIEGGRIENINVIKGEADIREDGDAGQIFIVPLVKKSINVFVTTDKGKNYLLVLKPTKMNADSIVIREQEAPSKEKMQEAQDMQRKAQIAKLLQRNSEPYTSQIKQFLQDIASNNLRENDIACALVKGDEIPLWKEAYFVHLGKCSNANLVAQVYTLTNISRAPMVVEEPELYKKGALAISVQQHQLAPNQSTKVYLVFPINH